MLCIRDGRAAEEGAELKGRRGLDMSLTYPSDSDWTSGKVDLALVSDLLSRPLGTGMCWAKPFAPCSELCHDPHFTSGMIGWASTDDVQQTVTFNCFWFVK